MKLPTLILLAVATLVPHSLRAADKPNIIFILSDDQRYDSLGITGNSITKTPNLDRLANEGVFFSQAFVTSPICGPSRANFLTGQWERKNEIGFDYVSHNVISEEVFQDSFLMKLKKDGYSTAIIGKHHTKIGDRGNTPLKKNIDFCYYKEGHLGFHLDKHPVFSNLKSKTQVEGLFEATEAYLKPGDETDYFFENADKSLKGRLERRDSKKPFCAWINFNLPHAASIGGMGSRPEDPEIYSKLYADQLDQIDLPAGYPVDIPFPSEVFNEDDLMGYYRTKNRKALLGTKVKMSRAVHAIDLFVGNLRKLLEEIDESENTIIVFTSDNGLFLGEHGLGGKTILYEESVHVPLIIHSPFFPKDRRGKSLDQLVVGQDVSATILDLCGVDVPESYQGMSLRPLIDNSSTEWREDVFFENLFTDQGYPRQESVRGTEFKYIRSFSKEKDRKQYLPGESIAGEQAVHEELYNLNDDPTEQKNLASNPEYSGILKKHRARCQKLVTELAK
ncbi:sulfatase-like hydrolase/transferase [Haloferula sp.]|uniref:sulfatase-like hydrolase/transferase n=1 Tax=Haloferula sp. TaxID=2497595 RepID=UPI0032A1176B